MQDKFSWAGVAAAGVGAGVGFAVANGLGAKPLAGDNKLSNHLAHLGANTASLIASAATRSAIEGSSFGDNIRAGLPDVIGQAINNVVGNGLSLPTEEVEASPVASAGGFRSTGLKYEAVIKIPVPLQKPTIPEKFGGPRSSQFDYSVHFGPENGEGWLQWGLDSLAGAWDGAERAIDGMTGHVERVWDDISEEVIVVTADLIDYASWKIDRAVRGVSNFAQTVALSQLEDARVQRVQSEATGQVISSGFRRVQQFNDTNFSRGHVPRVMDYMAPPTGALSGAFDPATPLLFAQHPDMVSGVRPLKYGDVVNPIVEIGGAAYIALKAPKVLGVTPIAGEAKAGIIAAERRGNSLVPQIGGRAPINSRYAGQTHPSGVTFTLQGFPDFKPYAKAEVGLRGLTGAYRADAALANAAVGLKATPKGYVWHHVEDGITMQLIPEATHNLVRHTGGVAVIRNGGFD